MSHLTLTDAVADYARAVRAHLADLGPELVDDLTDGLEADLAEAIADAAEGLPPAAAPTTYASDPEAVPDVVAPAVDDLAARFGSPQDYASELRAAAGIAPAAGRDKGRGRASVEALSRRAVTAVTRAPWWPGFRDFAFALRPVWWVLRGWLIGALVVIVLSNGRGRFIDEGRLGGAPGLAPAGFLEAIVFGLGIVVSVQYGRGLWVLRRRWNILGQVVSGLAVVAALPVLVTLNNAVNNVEIHYEYIGEPDWQTTTVDVGGDTNALIAGGERVRNLFVYGPDGEYIDGAQIVDQDGRPLLLTPEGSMWEPETETQGETSSYWVPREDVNGRQVWNAYPLGYWNNHMADWDEEAQTWVLPAWINPWPKAPVISSLAPLAEGDAATGETPEGDDAKSDDAKADDDAKLGEPADGDKAPSGGSEGAKSSGTKKVAGGPRGAPTAPTVPVRNVPQGEAAAR